MELLLNDVLHLTQEEISNSKIEFNMRAGTGGQPILDRWLSVTMNTYTHLGLDDAKDEMIRLQELEDARKEVEKTTGRPVVAKQSMFRAV